MTLKAQILDDVKSAMRKRDQKRLTALRLITAAIKQIEVDKRVELDEQGVLAVLDKMVKQRRDSLQQYEAAGRDDLAAQEAYELELIGTYLPEALSDEEVTELIHQAIDETGASSIRDMGMVMNKLRGEVQGRADMKAVSNAVKDVLQST
ncbi:MAG: GatB/YqeY domain-containing protein [Xanthomonadales bacterium]|nr:GatB/YqeY domain-containing protein [Xanthomonadales bacterium]